MRLKLLLMGACLLLATTLSHAQSTASNGRKVLKGKIEMKTLMNDSSFAWFYAGVNKYQPNENMLNYIKDNRGKFTVVAIIGTWDDESRRLLPALYKILILAGSPDEQIITYGADEKLQTGVQVGYQTKKVPTFIIVRDGKELGRLSTDLQDTLEGDIARILLKANRKDKD
ncbi:hypothetical protein SIO70_03675 [Chitinophaga sancti]|uniref:hypothetical protein n=1 Tax=Chitinophaga sancti TaxID=1004 RepID=UPI002A753989|nr:hypothetical protein [Chitinophaga sancti]WPQ63958.1 hypothetical protein SIO70_03675 [Chitinophaga sancti]